MQTSLTGLLTQHPWVSRRRLTVAEYRRMGEAGILGEDDRVELIEGELVAMSPIGCLHSGTINALNQLLVMSVGRRAVVAVQNPVCLDEFNEPQPDFAVLMPREDWYRSATPQPADVLLLVEVADSSLKYDRSVKLPLYARHAIPEIWIVNVESDQVEVYRNPENGGYRVRDVVERAGVLSPARLPEVVIAVSGLFR